MNVKKIIKGIIGLGAIGGVAYAAYKLGEKNGEVNERFRQKYDEIALVLDENNELNDVALYALGLESKEDISQIMDAAINGTVLEDKGQTEWSYEDICNAQYRIVLNSDCYSYDEATGLYHDLRDTDTGLSYLYDNGIPLRVTGIIRPSEDATAPMLTGSIVYTKDLTEYIIGHTKESDVVSAQKCIAV